MKDDDSDVFFTLGAKVRLVGLKTQSELNGATGVLVNLREDNRWQVQLDNDLGNKILKAKNLELVDPQASYAAEETINHMHGEGDPEWFQVIKSLVFVKQAPSKNAKGLGLIRDGQRIQVQPKRVNDADGGPSKWVEITPTQLRRLPECTGGDEATGYVLIDGTHLGLGTLLRGPLPFDECPEDGEYPVAGEPPGKKQTLASKPTTVSGIWDNTDDDAARRPIEPEKSDFTHILQTNGDNGVVEAEAPPKKEPEKQQPSVSIPQDLQEHTEYFEVLKSMVFIKEQPDKDSKSLGYATGDQKLQVYRQRVYDSDSRMWVELTALQLWRLPHCSDNSGRGFALIDGTSIGVGKLLKGPLPSYEWPDVNLADVSECNANYAQPKEHTFQVNISDAYIHELPTIESPKVQKVRQGMRMIAVEETFDGWAKLTGDAGWVRRCKHDQEKLHEYLKNAEENPPLLATMENVKAGEKRFRVAARPRVPVRVAPDRKSRLRSAKEFGEYVWAESQTYDGWVRLKDGEGWILGYSLEDGPFLHAMLFEEVANWCKACRSTQQVISRGIGYEEDKVNAEIRGTKNNLTEILSSEDPEEVRAALYRAKAWGIVSDETWAAEVRLDELRRFGFVEELGGKSTTRGVENNDEADGSNATEEPSKAVVTESSDKTDAVAAALADLVAATGTGDPVAIREATKLAKAAGVPKKDIARAYALHC